MEIGAFILDMFERMQCATNRVVADLTHDELTWRPGFEANSIGFILWHQARCEDAYVQVLIKERDEIWVSEKWYQKLNLPDNPLDTGYDYTAEQIAAFSIPELEDLLGYAAAVRAQTVEYLKGMTHDESDKVIRERILGETTIGQLFSYGLCEINQHIGQIAYLRGLQRGLNK